MSGLTVFNTKEVETKKQPMFFGQPLGVQRYDGSKYPVFEKLTQQQLGYFWRPEEVSLQKDRSDYQNLTAEQKHIFTSNLKLPTPPHLASPRRWCCCSKSKSRRNVV